MDFHKNNIRTKLLVSIITIAILLCSSCSSKTKHINRNAEIKKLEYNSEYASTGVKVCALDVNTITTTEEDHRDHKLYLPEFDEPIYITFGLAGADSQAILRLYYDYEPISFLTAESLNYTDEYIFNIADGTRLEIPVYLSSDLGKDDLTHKLMVVVIIDCDRHASEIDNITDLMMYGSTGVFDLSFTEAANRRETTIAESKYSILNADNYGKFSYTSLNFTDGMQDLSSQGFYEPEKIYVKNMGEVCSLNYTVSKFDNKVENALILLTVGYRPIQINNQDYLFINLGDNTTAAGEISFELPDEAGKYDVIGYVVFNPFSYTSMDLCDIPQSNTRFTIVCTD